MSPSPALGRSFCKATKSGRARTGSHSLLEEKDRTLPCEADYIQPMCKSPGLQAPGVPCCPPGSGVSQAPQSTRFSIFHRTQEEDGLAWGRP